MSAPTPSWRFPQYIGAALDGDAQPDRAASCVWLQEATRALLAAGITPLALHSVIALGPSGARSQPWEPDSRVPWQTPCRLDPHVHPLPH